MKIKIRKDSFMRGLRLASGVADRKATLQILASVLLRAKKPGSLTVGATDLTVSALATLEATVEKEGNIAIPARQLHDIVRELPGEDVALSLDNDTRRLTIKAGRSQFVLPGHNAADFPKLPDPSEASVKVDAPILREVLERTVFSVSTDETRQHLAVISFTVEGGKVICVSTDGHRLSKIGRDFVGAPNMQALIPRKGVQEIINILQGREAPVGLSVAGNTIAVRVDEIGLWARLSDASFPPWEQVVPKDDARRAVVSRTAFMETLARATIISGRSSAVALTFGKGFLRIEADDPDVGHAKEDLDAETTGDDEIKVGANASYLRDWLMAASSEKVRISVMGDLDPIVLRPDDGSDYVGVIMPLRID